MISNHNVSMLNRIKLKYYKSHECSLRLTTVCFNQNKLWYIGAQFAGALGAFAHREKFAQNNLPLTDVILLNVVLT